jgi:hypothetical protein
MLVLYITKQVTLTSAHQGPHRVVAGGTGKGKEGSAEKQNETLFQFTARNGRDLSVEEKQLLKVLTRVRRDLSAEADLPPATICSEPLLMQLVLERPSCTNNLVSINGASQAFIGKYGERFCAEIVNFCRNEYIELEVDSGGWVNAPTTVNAPSTQSSCPSYVAKRVKVGVSSSSQSGGFRESGRHVPEWMGRGVGGIKRHKSEVHGVTGCLIPFSIPTAGIGVPNAAHAAISSEDAHTANVEEEERRKNGGGGGDCAYLSTKMQDFLQADSKLETFLNASHGAAEEAKPLSERADEYGKKERLADENASGTGGSRREPREDAGVAGLQNEGQGSRLKRADSGAARRDLMADMDKTAQSQALLGKVQVGVDAVYNTFNVVLLGKATKGLVKLWAASRIHCLLNLEAQREPRDSLGCSQSENQLKVRNLILKALGPVVDIVYRNLEVTDRAQEAFDLFFDSGASVEALARRFSVDRDTIIGYLACVLSLNEAEQGGQVSMPHDSWSQVLQTAGVDASAALNWNPAPEHIHEARGGRECEEARARKRKALCVYDIEDDVDEEEVVSIEELEMIELACRQAEGRLPQASQHSTTTTTIAKVECDTSRAGEEVLEEVQAPSLNRDALLNYIYENRRQGVELDSLRNNFFVDNAVKETALQTLLLSLEEAAEVYREGPTKIFPI